MGRVVALKGIRIGYEPNTEVGELIERYTRAVQDFLDIAVGRGITSLGRINGWRQEVRRRHGLSGATAVLAMKDALAIYKAWRRKKGKRSNPRISRPFMKAMHGYSAKLMPDDRLRITRFQGDYIYLKLKVGEYQRRYLDAVRRGELKLGIIVVTPEHCVFPVSRETEPFEPEGILALDVNEKHVDGLVLKGEKAEFYRWDLREVFEASTGCMERFRAFQSRYPQRFRLHEHIATKWFGNRNHYVDWFLHNLVNRIIELAARERLKIVMEDLKGLKLGINRKRMRRTMRGRLNRWMARRIQRIIQYKSNWNSIPLSYVPPRGTSSTCPRCGVGLKADPDWHHLACPSCGIKGDRDRIACVNIAKLEDEGLRFGPDWWGMIATPSVA